MKPLDHFPPGPTPTGPQKPAKAPETAQEFYEMAEWASFYRLNTTAIENLNKAIELQPDFVDAYRGRFSIRFRLANYQEAIKDLSAEIELVPESRDAYMFRGICKFKLRDYPGALADLDTSIDIGTANKMSLRVDALEFRGKVRYVLGNYDGAIEDSTRAEIPMRHTSPRFFRALTYIKKGNERRAMHDLKFLAERYEIAREQYSKNYPPKYPKKEIEERQFPYGENPFETDQISDRRVKDRAKLHAVEPVKGAGVCFSGYTSGVIPGRTPFEDRFLADTWFFPNKERPASSWVVSDDVVYHMLGDLYEKRGDITNALKTFTSSIVARNVGSEISHCRRGRLLLASGQFERAASDFSWAIRGWGNPVNIFLERGIAIYMLGYDKIAQKDFDKFLSLNPPGKGEMDARIEAAKKLRKKLGRQKTQK